MGKLLGKDFELTNQQKNYNNLRYMFFEYAKDGSIKFYKLYNEKIMSYDDLHNKGFQLGADIIISYLNKVEEYVIKLGLYDFDLEEFCNNYSGVMSQWVDTFDEIDDIYMSAKMRQDEMEEYRGNRKACRGRWSGGGFGISGALKGAAKAGALNMTTGIAHSVANGIGNTYSAIKTNIQLSNKFRNKDTYLKLQNALVYSIEIIHLALIDYLVSVGIGDFEIPTEEKQKKSYNIIKHLDMVELEEEKIKELIIDAIVLNPYNINAYRYELKRFGDENNSIGLLLDYLDINSVELKLIVLEESIDNIGALNGLNTSDDVINWISKLQINLKYLSIDEDSCKYITEARTKFQELEVKERTVEGIVYDTKEIAERVVGNLAKAKEILNQVDKTSIDSLQKALRELRDLNDNEKCIVKYIDEYEKIKDLTERTVLGIEFNTREEAENTREYEYTVNQCILDSFDENNNINYDILLGSLNKASISDEIKKVFIDKYTLERNERLIKKENTFKKKMYIITSGVVAFIFITAIIIVSILKSSSSAEANKESTQQHQEKAIQTDEKVIDKEVNNVKDDTKITTNESDKKVNYKKYSNSRFGFSIEYPDYLSISTYPENGDGVTLETEDRSTRLSVWASYNILNQNAEQSYNEVLNNISNVSYKTLIGDRFIVSWEAGDFIYYYCEEVGTNQINAFQVTYPKTNKDEMDEVITKIYSSFNPSN